MSTKPSPQLDRIQVLLEFKNLKQILRSRGFAAPHLASAGRELALLRQERHPPPEVGHWGRLGAGAAALITLRVLPCTFFVRALVVAPRGTRIVVVGVSVLLLQRISSRCPSQPRSLPALQNAEVREKVVRSLGRAGEA